MAEILRILCPPSERLAARGKLLSMELGHSYALTRHVVVRAFLDRVDGEYVPGLSLIQRTQRAMVFHQVPRACHLHMGPWGPYIIEPVAAGFSDDGVPRRLIVRVIARSARRAAL